jgi:heat shock protein HtpX
MGKRVLLFLLTNLLVILTVTLIVNLFGIQPYLNEQGINFQALLIFCALFGMGGAFISLSISRFMAKKFMGVKIIDPQSSADPRLQKLVQTVHQLSRSAGLPQHPEVGVYQSPEPNAFATGPTKAKALVAVSTGLLQRMNDDELEGVLGHEIAHIANGDMVTMTLLQGVVNTFVMFAARVVAHLINNALRSNDRGGGGLGFFGYIATVWILDAIFMIFGSLVIAGFSRYREYRADAGGARLAGRDKMIQALQALQRTVEIRDPNADHPAFKSMKISGRGGIAKLWSSHPPLDARIAELQRRVG